jgi:precorrin-8X/cobalt-precorrin-8 methylmutase
MFDAYIAVDWSAASKPRHGQDSVWLCVHGSEPENPRTRAAATERVRDLLRAHVREGQRVLVGFDFPYGYPHGFGAWRETWELLSTEIRDDDENRNNRFDVAARINRRFGGGGPFWGGGVSRKRGSLAGLAEFRETDRGLRVQSPWKLWGAGSVGGQALVGIPRVASLRDDPELRAVSRVWPFEPLNGAQIVHAEIWPGTVPLEPRHPIRDAAQVATVVAHWARLDAAGALEALFDRPATDEGWILGA